MSKNTKTARIFALGGMLEVGKNMYCVEYNDQIFIIDCGILFPDEHLLGVDYVVPSFEYLKDKEEKIVGLFVTHGHEDHIGGIPFFLKEIKVPKIYAAGVTVQLIKNKLEEYKDIRVPEIVEFTANDEFKFDHTSISFIRMTHSVPDTFGIVIRTGAGTIFHTGDFKFDMTPTGPQCEFDKLAELGKEGVDLLLADSTNATVPGYTKSEKNIGQNIRELFKHIHSRILVATFASNIYRVQQIVEAAVDTNRKIAIFGRSMIKTIEVGQKIGYIKAPATTFIDVDDIKNYKANELVVICTGSQGEPMAALSRIAQGTHKQVKLMPGDTVIFSSSPIPGNQVGVNTTINQLFKNGCNVIVHSPITDTHTSGHAAQGDLRMLQNLLHPKYFMPIHGEYRMLKVHGNLAIECGLNKDNLFVLENGDVLELTDHTIIQNGKVPASDVYIDGAVSDLDSSIIHERKSLSDDGLFSVIFTIVEKDRKIALEPQVVSRGFVYMKEAEELTKNIVEASKTYLAKALGNPKLSYQQIQNDLADYLSHLVKEISQRNPIVLPLFSFI
ncbi:MAG: ribonuclease J [Acholeplasmatales bacterium]|nr:ribonuclease J [Acholeplasmatales bacterium]